MKNLLWIVLAAIVLIGGYVLVTGKSPSEIIEAGKGAIEAPAESDAVDNAAKAAADAATEAADEASEVGNEAADVAAEAADKAADAVKGAADAVEDTANDAADAASDAAESADEAAAEGALSIENFNMDTVVQMIDNSSIVDTTKTLLKTTLQQAKDSPELLKAALDQVRTALGM